MSEAWLSLESARQRREQQQENAARDAQFHTKHTTSGTGESVSGLIRFGTKFSEQPWVSTGAVIQKLPDVAHYRYPTVTAGVIRWQTEPIGPPDLGRFSMGGQTEDPRPKLYIGAFVVFVVQCDPRNIPNTDGGNVAELKKKMDALAGNPTTPAYKTAKALYDEAVEARWLLDPKNKAKVVVEHHLTFTGVAVKAAEMTEDPLLKQVTFDRPRRTQQLSGQS